MRFPPFFRFLIWCLLFIGTSALTLVAAPRPKVNGKTVLRLSKVPMPGERSRAEFDLFLAQNPDITLEQAQGLAIEGMGSQSQLLLAMAAGSGPDVFYGALSDIGSYYAQRFVGPVTDLYQRDQKEMVPILDQVKSSLYYDGELYAVPQFYKVMALGNRRDYLNKYLGVNGDEPPRNWDEWFRWCLKLTRPEHGIYGLGIYGGAWIFEIYLRLAGGEMLEAYKVDPKNGEMIAALPGVGPTGEPLFPERNEKTGTVLKDVEVKWRSVADQLPAIRAANFQKRLLWVEWIRVSETGTELIFVDYPDYDTGKPVVYDQVRDPVSGRNFKLVRGKRPTDDVIVDDQGNTVKVNVGVARLYIGDTNYIDDFLTGRVAMLPIPGGRDAVFDDRFSPDLVGLTMFPPGLAPWGRAATELNAGCYAINAQVTDPDVRDAAWRWIKFQTGADRMALKVRQWVEDGLAAYVLPEWLERFGYEEYLNEVPKAWIQQNKQLEQVALPVASAPGMRVAGAALTQTLERIYLDPNLDVATELKEKVSYINRYLLNEDNSAFLQKARPYAYAVGGVALLVMAFILKHLWYGLKQEARKGGDAEPSGVGKASRKRYHLLAWSMMLPALALVIVFEYYPLIQGSIMAFQDYQVLGDRPFVGLDNFISVLTSASFWHSIRITLYYVCLLLTIGFFAPVVLALLLSEIPRLQYFFRVIYFLPAVTSGFIIMILWKQFFDPTPTGLLNQIVSMVGLGPYRWLQDPSLALACTVIPGIWAGAGPGCLLYLAALKTVSSDLYEAADIDGAGWWMKVRCIAIPTIMPLMIINFIGAFIGAFHGMGNILVMTGGGPDRSTQVIGLEIWMNAFIYFRYGYATSMAWILAAALVGFVALKMRLLKRMEFRASGVN